MSGCNYNYGYRNSAQSNQTSQRHHQQSTPSRKYSPQRYQSFLSSRSGALPNQRNSNYAHDTSRYQYNQDVSAPPSGSASGGWSFQRNGSAVNGSSSDVQYGTASDNGVANSYVPTTQSLDHSQHTRNVTYSSYAQPSGHAYGAQTSTYGQQPAHHTETVSSSSTTTPVQRPTSSTFNSQQATGSAYQRPSQDFRNITRSTDNQDTQQQSHTRYAPTSQAPTISSVAPVTVDPSQVYDRSAEIQREVAKAEAIRAAEEEAKRLEEATNARKLEEARNFAQKGAEAEAAPKKKRNKQSSNAKATSADAAANAAAMTLLQTANSGSGEASTDDIADQMKAVFAKMRELNAKNPDLLSKMWQQERESYLEDEAKKDQQTPKHTEASDATPAQAKKTPKRTPKKDVAKTSTKSQVNGKSPKSASQSKEQTEDERQATKPPSTGISSIAPLPHSENSTNKTVWPEKKKAQLAQAASSLISKIPGNDGRVLPPKEIADMLSGNPSYLELCLKIEAKGFQIHRSQFAKALLTAVPEVNCQKINEVTGQAQQSRLTTAADGAQTNHSTTQAQQQRTALGDAENRLMSGESIIGKSPKTARPRKPMQPVETSANSGASPVYLDGLDAVKQFNEQPVNSPTTVISSNTETTKGKKKHKPSVTQLPPLPPTKEDLARKRTFADLVDLTELSDEDGEPSTKRLHVDNDSQVSVVKQTVPQQLPTPPQSNAPQAVMVAPLGSQQPPPSQPDHLQHYPRPNFFPPAAPSTSVFKPAQNIPRDHPINNVMAAQKIDRSKVLRCSKYNPRTIARDVLLASGRHPDMRHLNAHLDVLRNLKMKDDVDLSTIRWDVIDPDGALPGAGIFTEPRPEDELDDTLLADDESSEDELTGHPTQSIPLGGGSAATVAASAADPNLRIRHYKPRKSDPAGARQLATPYKASPAGGSASAPGSGYSALRAATGDVKKKGRPVGWRKYMQKDRIEDTSSPAPPLTGPSGEKRRGRPPGTGSKGTNKKPPPKPPSPDFPAFKCEWEGCAAELHNLDTLRRHLYKVHGEKRAQMEWVCRWRGCGKTTAVTEGPRTVSKFVRRIFEQGGEWRTHVEDEHLSPIKWKQGDGPAAGLTEGDGKVSDAVLSDREGRQVTPRISMPSSPADAFTRVEQDRGEGAQGPALGSAGGRRQTPLEEAQGELYSVEERRRRLGVGIDKGGATMVNDKRRRGFLEDGDVEMVDDED